MATGRERKGRKEAEGERRPRENFLATPLNLLNSTSSCFEILDSKRIGVTTWGHVTSWSRDHSIPSRPFPVGGPLKPNLYL